MKKHISILWFMIIFSSYGFSQVSGVVYLKNKTKHQDICVKFIAQSPSAKTDSTFTNYDGVYNINLKAGVYLISFSKDSTYTDYYNFNNKILVSTIFKLDTFYLNGRVKYISGNLDGKLDSNAIYFVKGNINVSYNDTLNIEPGTKIQFLGNFSFTITGFLCAEGTFSNYIHFTSAYKTQSAGDWEGIIISIDSKYCSISNCLIEYTNTSVLSSGGITKITDNIIRYTNKGICVNRIVPQIYNNDISNFSLVGIDASDIVTPISCNIIHDGKGTAIQSKRGGRIMNNYIYKIKSPKTILSNSCAISLSETDSCIQNNLIVDCDVAIILEEYSENNNNKISNNTIVRSIKGIEILSLVRLKIVNNIFYDVNSIINNDNQINVNDFFQNNLIYKYNQISDKGNFIGLGTLISKNENGDSTDAYNNIYGDPNFSNTYSFTIDSTSSAYTGSDIFSKIGYEPRGTCLISKIYNFSNDTLSITGKVHENLGNSINAIVFAINITNNSSYATLCDNSGNFKINQLPKGEYIIKSQPTTPSIYTTTYYPNHLDSINALKMNLGGSVQDVDIYMQQNEVSNSYQNDAITIYPNPFDNDLIITSNTSSHLFNISQITIYGLDGKTHKNINFAFQPDLYDIDMSFLLKGIYMLKIVSNSGVFIKKINKK